MIEDVIKTFRPIVDRLASRPEWRPYALVALGLFGLQLVVELLLFVTNRDWVLADASRFEVSTPIAAVIGGVGLADRSVAVIGADLIATLALLLTVRRFWGEAQTTTLLSLLALAAIVSVAFNLIGLALSTTAVQQIYLGYLLLDPAAPVVAALFWVGLPNLLSVSKTTRTLAVVVFLFGSFVTSFVEWYLATSATRLFAV